MYSTWWSFVVYAASAVSPATGKPYSPPEVSEAASEVSRTVGGAYASYNPIGVSQLFGIARKIANSANRLNSADPGAALDSSMVAEAPWSRPAADQAAMPVWQARAEVTYLDPAGIEQQGIFTVQIPQVLPSTVGSLQTQMELRISDMLGTPEGTGTPRSGTFVALGAITVMAV